MPPIIRRSRVTRTYPKRDAVLITMVCMREREVVVEREVGDGDAIPREVLTGETTRLDASELYGLIERSEGAEVAQRVVAAGTPSTGLPQVIDVESTAPVAQPHSRLRDILLGGAISLTAMIAWYCATHL